MREQIEEARHDAALPAVEDAGDVLEHLGVASEVLDELGHGSRGSRGRLILDTALRATEDLDFGAAESIDGLLGIADGAQGATALARQEVDEVDLLLVGVLEFIDHDHGELAGVRLADAGVVAQRLIGETEEVVVVERRALRLEGGVLVADGAGEREHVHDEARGTEAALLGALLGHAARQTGGLRLQPLERGDRTALHARHGDGTREDGALVEPHRAQAAARGLAAALDGLASVRAQEVEQGHVRGDVLNDAPSVQGEFHRAASLAAESIGAVGTQEPDGDAAASPSNARASSSKRSSREGGTSIPAASQIARTASTPARWRR